MWGDLLQVRRQRLIWLGLALASLVFIAVVEAWGAGEESVRTLYRAHPEGWATTVLPGVEMLFQYSSGLLMLLVSAWLMGACYGSGVLRLLLARGAGRLQVLLARLLVLVLFALLLLLIGAALTAIYFGSVALAAQGSLGGLLHLSPSFWRTLGLGAGAEMVSMLACGVLGMTAAVIGRSVAFGVGVAVAFFPADSLYCQWAPLLGQLTRLSLWGRVTGYLLGPDLNALTQRMRVGPPSRVPVPVPVGDVSTVHAATVVAIWMVGLLVLAAVLIQRRDVQQ
jgi:ABC-type transport system involved in multi-copper enzyme maturation permease subunit